MICVGGTCTSGFICIQTALGKIADPSYRRSMNREGSIRTRYMIDVFKYKYICKVWRFVLCVLCYVIQIHFPNSGNVDLPIDVSHVEMTYAGTHQHADS